VGLAGVGRPEHGRDVPDAPAPRAGGRIHGMCGRGLF
jgi:hypothetical protein